MTDEFYRRYLDENLDRMLEDMEKDKNHTVQQVQDGTKDKTGETSALQPASPGIISSPAYASVEWMPEKRWEKVFNAGLKKIKRKGYDRYPRPDEFFSLIIEHMEGRLTGSLRDIAEYMLSGEGEWLSMVVQREGSLLVCYVDPENIKKKWDTNRYYVNGKMGYSDRKEFDIKGAPSEVSVSLDNLDDGLVRFLYGRSFSELPESVQKRDPTIYLPEEGEIRPVSQSRASRGSRFSIDCCNYYGACRGVKSKSDIEKRNEEWKELVMVDFEEDDRMKTK